MTTSAYRLQDTMPSVDNVIDFDSYHRTHKVTTCRFVPSTTAHSASIAQPTSNYRSKHSNESYLRRMVWDIAPNCTVMAVAFCLMVKLLGMI